MNLVEHRYTGHPSSVMNLTVIMLVGGISFSKLDFCLFFQLQ